MIVAFPNAGQVKPDGAADGGELVEFDGGPFPDGAIDRSVFAAGWAGFDMGHEDANGAVGLTGAALDIERHDDAVIAVGRFQARHEVLTMLAELGAEELAVDTVPQPRRGINVKRAAVFAADKVTG